MIWNEAKECMPREQIEALQSARLKKQVDRVYHNVEYYRRKMQAVGLEPGDIRGIEDIEKLPFMTNEDLAAAYPLGLLAVPRSEIIRIHATSGTTGKPKIGAYTRRDVDIWAEGVARCMAMAGVTREDIVLVSYGYGLFTGGLGAHYGAEKLGAMVIPVSTGNTQKLITMLIDFQATVIACTPSYLLHIAETLERENKVDQIKLKCCICGAEPWTDEMRDQIEKRLHIKAYDIYGLTEMMGPGVANDCEFHRGLHVWEDHFLPEIIDPATGKHVAPGESGELVMTTLTKEGLPLIRYRTRDLTSLQYEPCQCGRTMARIQRFKGRTDDMLIIKGVNVFPTQVEAALLTIDGTTPHYLMVVDRVDNQDTLEIQIEVEERFFSDEIRGLEGLADKVRSVLKTAIGLNAKVKLVEPDTLEHSQGKTKHVVDKRKLYE